MEESVVVVVAAIVPFFPIVWLRAFAGISLREATALAVGIGLAAAVGWRVSRAQGSTTRLFARSLGLGLICAACWYFVVTFPLPA